MWLLLCAAHPRVGGENLNSSRMTGHMWGSSPRGRGKLPECVVVVRQCGLIPAWAGKTIEEVQVRGQTLAHPRVGGENSPKARRG